MLAPAEKILEIPILATEQNPARLGPTDKKITQYIDQYFSKTCFNAAGIDSLRTTLQQKHNAKKTQLIMAGCETHICVLQSALGFIELGYDVFIVADACGSRKEENHSAALFRLQNEKCKIVTTEMVLFEWLCDAAHPKFKEIQQLIK